MTRVTTLGCRTWSIYSLGMPAFIHIVFSSVMAYIYLSSDDSLDYFPNNTNFDFTVEFAQEFRGAYRLALCEIYFTQATEDLYVFCDVCTRSRVLDDLLPLLRIVRAPGELSNLYYQELTRPILQRIRLYIRDKSLNVPSFDIGTVRCTLRLEPI